MSSILADPLGGTDFAWQNMSICTTCLCQHFNSDSYILSFIKKFALIKFINTNFSYWRDFFFNNNWTGLLKNM